MAPVKRKSTNAWSATPATSTPSERVASAAGCEFTCTCQSLSSSVFIMTMTLQSWMNAGILKIPGNQAKLAAAIFEEDMTDIAISDVEATFQLLDEEQENWDEEILDDGVTQMLNHQFDQMIVEANRD